MTKTVGPGPSNKQVLAMELRTFIATDGREHRHSQAGAIVDRTEFACAYAIQPNVILEKWRLGQGSKVIDSTDTHNAMHHIGWKRGIPYRPVGRGHHCGQVGTSRVAGNHDSLGVHAHCTGVLVKPADRAQKLPDHFLHGSAWSKAIVNDREVDVSGDKRRRKKAEISFVEATPIASMKKYQKRLPTLFRVKEVKLFITGLSVRNIEVSGQCCASAN